MPHDNDDLYITFGYNLNGLKVAELHDILSANCIRLPATCARPVKADLLYAVERYYAKERLAMGDAPTDYLKPNFNRSASQYKWSHMRQLLAQFGLRSPADSCTATAAFFDRNLQYMRDNTRQPTKPAPAAGIEDLTANMAKLPIWDPMPPPDERPRQATYATPRWTTPKSPPSPQPFTDERLFERAHDSQSTAFEARMTSRPGGAPSYNLRSRADPHRRPDPVFATQPQPLRRSAWATTHEETYQRPGASIFEPYGEGVHSKTGGFSLLPRDTSAGDSRGKVPASRGFHESAFPPPTPMPKAYSARATAQRDVHQSGEFPPSATHHSSQDRDEPLRGRATGRKPNGEREDRSRRHGRLCDMLEAGFAAAIKSMKMGDCIGMLKVVHGISGEAKAFLFGPEYASGMDENYNDADIQTAYNSWSQSAFRRTPEESQRAQCDIITLLQHSGCDAIQYAEAGDSLTMLGVLDDLPLQVGALVLRPKRNDACY
ncbi:hypothetical protein MBLNU230_g4880t1 [Neophaeotheca triangularis]